MTTEKVQMVLLDRINLAKNIPVNMMVTGWCSQWSFVYPSVLSVEDTEKLAISHLADLCRFTMPRSSKIEAVKEMVNLGDFSCGNAHVIVNWIKNNSECWGHESCVVCLLLFPRQMNGVHFKGIPLTINCMLGFSMELELCSFKLCANSISLSSILARKEIFV